MAASLAAHDAHHLPPDRAQRFLTHDQGVTLPRRGALSFVGRVLYSVVYDEDDERGSRGLHVGSVARALVACMPVAWGRHLEMRQRKPYGRDAQRLGAEHDSAATSAGATNY